MMGLRGVINNLLSLLGTKLLPSVIASAQAPSSSNCPPADQNHQVEAELKKLQGMLERIKATLYDAEQREIRDKSVKLWLKELKGVAYDAEDVLDEYHYEFLRAEVEARDASSQDSRKRKLIQVPYDMLGQIQQIRSRFDEIMEHRIALQLSEGDGPMRCNNELHIAPVGPFVVESNIFGRESEKEKLIKLLSSERDVVSVVTIVGMGGIGKTTLAQLTYNDQRIRQKFDKFGWICVSEDFNVERLTKESLESITEDVCGITNLGALQEKLLRVISGKRVLLVLDDVWNEKKSFWDSFQTPFMSAKFAKILVTTRNDPVARIMQTEPTFKIGCLSTEQCWRLFEHYAFGGVDQNKSPKLVGIGKQIMKKCGMLPLAVKSIASLLRYEAEEESWREILESELWESDASKEIFPPLQISYARLPTYLKSCFLYCSMFPKDHVYDVEDLVKLWMYQGFIESKGNKTPEKIGFEYVQQLCQRSLFEREGMYERNDLVCRKFKLHDIVHDLARCNSEDGCLSITSSKLPIFPNVLHHLYIAEYVMLRDPIPSDKVATLRTLIITIENFSDAFDFSMAPKLRALVMQSDDYGLGQPLSSMKHLRYLSLGNVETLPECICSLYSLRNLSLKECSLKVLPRKIGNLISLEELIINECKKLEVLPESLCQLKALRKLSISSCYKMKELPNNIGNVVSLEELRIDSCSGLRVLPGSLCQLKALRKLCLMECVLLEELPSDMGSLTDLKTLKIWDTGVSCLPSLSKFVEIQELEVGIECKTIGWLKNFHDLGGKLCLTGLKNISNLMDVRCANLMSMHNLEHLALNWHEGYGWNRFDMPKLIGTRLHSIFHLKIKRGENIFLEKQSCFSVMASLRPHPNLTKLEIGGCNCITFPEWIGSLCKLKYLKITSCDSLQFLKAESLPLELEQLEICGCYSLVSMPGIQNLKSLVKLSISFCQNLCSFMEPYLELTMRAGVGSYWTSLLGLTNLPSLRSLKISFCKKLQVSVHELLPAEPCKVEVWECRGLMEWCLQHGINYEDLLPLPPTTHTPSAPLPPPGGDDLVPE
ncbi:putative disease resistance RPP13-like protein 1 [Carex rostrata]